MTLCCFPQGKDDVTGEPLIQHDDDKPEALMARLRHYKDVAKPVIDLYKSVNTSFHGTVYTQYFLRFTYEKPAVSVIPVNIPLGFSG